VQHVQDSKENFIGLLPIIIGINFIDFEQLFWPVWTKDRISHEKGILVRVNEVCNPGDPYVLVE
jgi:hypothetical protein